jgi:amino acid transporter
LIDRRLTRPRCDVPVVLVFKSCERRAILRVGFTFCHAAGAPAARRYVLHSGRANVLRLWPQLRRAMSRSPSRVPSSEPGSHEQPGWSAVTEQVSLEDFDDGADNIVVIDEKPLTWIDVSAIGTGELLFTGGWAWIMFIASSYGIKWTLIGFVGGALTINGAWWLYREMITAVPEAGSLQSFAREAGCFSLGTTYFVMLVPISAVFMWLELLVAQGLFHILLPSVPQAIWPYVTILPVLVLNLMGHQITGKVQAALVTATLIGDTLLGVVVWRLMAHHEFWAANWPAPTPVRWYTVFSVSGLWLAIMCGILEVQQVLVDEWSDFTRSRDIGLLSAAYSLWIRQIPLALGLMASAPLVALALMPVPTVQAVREQLGSGWVFYLCLACMLLATYTTLSVFFMAQSRILALYAQQGALPRIFARYSTRSVPWVSIIVMALFAVVGVYIANYKFLVDVLSCWSSTLYIVVAVLFVGMRRRRDLDRPLVVKYGVPIAVGLLIFASLIGATAFISNWRAGTIWAAFVAAFILYDKYVVPNTERGKMYRAQVLRRRTSAERL